MGAQRGPFLARSAARSAHQRGVRSGVSRPAAPAIASHGSGARSAIQTIGVEQRKLLLLRLAAGSASVAVVIRISDCPLENAARTWLYRGMGGLCRVQKQCGPFSCARESPHVDADPVAPRIGHEEHSL